MSTGKQNVAYDLSLFEAKPKESKERKNNVVKLPKDKLEANRRKKVKPLQALCVCLMSFTAVSVVATMVYSQVQLTELTDQINVVSNELAEKESVYTQLNMKAGSKFSLRAIEDISKSNLNMRKSEPSQIKYIKLSEGDKAEIANSSKCCGIIEKISQAISNLLS